MVQRDAVHRYELRKSSVHPLRLFVHREHVGVVVQHMVRVAADLHQVLRGRVNERSVSATCCLITSYQCYQSSPNYIYIDRCC